MTGVQTCALPIYPILPLNLENDNAGVSEKIAKELKEFLSSFDKLDLKNFD